MNVMARKPTPPEAFQARPITSDPDVLSAYFSQVASYEADRLRSYKRTARVGLTIGVIGAVVGLAGVLSVAALTPLKSVVALVFRVDNTTGAVERVYDVRGGQLAASEAEQRYFLWQYVRYRQGYNATEAQANFDAVALMSSPQVQNEYAAEFRGSNPNSPQVVLGRDGMATLRWVGTTFLSPKLAQVRFEQRERKGDTPLPPKHMVATIGFDFAPGEVSSSAINVNPRGFIVTSYRADMEITQ